MATIGHKFLSYHCIIKWLLGLWSSLLSYFEILEPELWCRWSTWPTPRCLAVASCISSQREKKECSWLERVSHVAVKSHLFTCTNGLIPFFFCQGNRELNVLKHECLETARKRTSSSGQHECEISWHFKNAISLKKTTQPWFETVELDQGAAWVALQAVQCIRYIWNTNQITDNRK